MIETKSSDQFPTDEWLYSLFENWFDPCPLNEAPTIDGLSIEWGAKTYCNPPYSDVKTWVRKGVAEHKKGKTIVFLLKFDSTTEWFRELRNAGAHILHLGERLKHGGKYSAPYPSALFVLK